MSLIYVVGLEKAVDSCTAGAMSLNEYSFYMEIFQVYVLCSIVQSFFWSDALYTKPETKYFSILFHGLSIKY